MPRTPFAALFAAVLSSACAGPRSEQLAASQQAVLQDAPAITGYSFGSKSLARSPVTLAELALLEQSLLFGEEDRAALRMSLEVLRPQVEEILDVWYGFVASTPQLVQYFADKASGQPQGDYLASVRVRFGQWILDTAAANYDQRWLDYQHEIGLRHHSTKKNTTDHAQSVPIIHLRYLLALNYPITATLKPFLAKGGHSPEQVERMHQAWIKSVLLQSILWSQPYVREGQF
jgi:hypothetical protein